MARFFFWLLILAGLCAGPAAAQDQVRHGAYLAILGDCNGCHSMPHQPAFSGGYPFTVPFGTLYSTNITPDHDTGIGGWSSDQFYRALHDGISANGSHLYPAFPYIYFTRISRADSDALLAYLKTLKPVHRPPTPNKLIFPFNIRLLMVFWNWLYLDKTPFQPDRGKSEAWNRGKWLVTGLGHCEACHTPKDIMFGDEKSRAFSGEVLENWYAANLNSNPRDGLGKWSEADLAHYLLTGHNQYATAVGSMWEKVDLSTSKMTDADRAAIATYLKSLPRKPQPPFETPQLEQMRRGKGVFEAHCANCHTAPGTQDKYPQLAGDTLVMGHDPTTVVRVILEGGALPKAPPQIKPMPAFDWLSDGDIADVATYIRNAWGNSGPQVTATQVLRLRRDIAASPD